MLYGGGIEENVVECRNNLAITVPFRRLEEEKEKSENVISTLKSEVRILSQ